MDVTVTDREVENRSQPLREEAKLILRVRGRVVTA